MNHTTIAKQTAKQAAALRRLTLAAMFAGLIMLMTAYLFHIPFGINGGYVHLGDALIYLGAAILPHPYACAAAAIGAGMADLLTAPVWVLPTLLIKSLICLPFTSKGGRFLNKRNLCALFFAFVISSLGYFLAESVMFGYQTAFLASLTGSVIQSGGSALVFVIVAASLDKMKLHQYLTGKEGFL